MKILLKLLIVLLVVLTACYFIPYSTTHQTSIKASFFDVANQVNIGNNWKNWYGPLKDSYRIDQSNYRLKEDFKNHKIFISTNNDNFEIIKHSPAWIEIQSGKITKTSQTIRFVFDKNGNVNIAETESSSLLKYFLNYFSPNKENKSIISSLKPFMETPSLYYGYDIKKTAVPDTAYIITTKIILKKDRFKMMDSTYNSLRQFAKKNKFVVTGKPYLNYTQIDTDSVRITTMLVINKTVVQYDDGKINFFAMPNKGNMLVAHYHGEYGNSTSVYTAMEKYVTDNNLSRVYTPFERFLGKVPKTEQSIVDMDVFYPIY